MEEIVDGGTDEPEIVVVGVGGMGRSIKDLQKSLKVVEASEKKTGSHSSTIILKRPVKDKEVVMLGPSEPELCINGVRMLEEFSFYENVFTPCMSPDAKLTAEENDIAPRTEMDEVELHTLEQFESNDLGPILVSDLAQVSLAFTGRKAGLRSMSAPLVKVFVNRVALSLEGGRWFLRAGLKNQVSDEIELDRTQKLLENEVAQEYDYGPSYSDASYTASGGPQMGSQGSSIRSRGRLPLNMRVNDYYHHRNAEEREKEQQVEKSLFVKLRMENEGVAHVKLLLASKGLDENDDIWKETIIFVMAAARALDHDMTSGKKEFEHEKEGREREVIPYSMRLAGKVAWTVLNENGYETSLSEVAKYLLNNPGRIASISKIDDLEVDEFVNDLLRLVSKAVLVHVAKNR